jgi:hypothetical protein
MTFAPPPSPRYRNSTTGRYCTRHDGGPITWHRDVGDDCWHCGHPGLYGDPYTPTPATPPIPSPWHLPPTEAEAIA